jgi:hypothetical protein
MLIIRYKAILFLGLGLICLIPVQRITSSARIAEYNAFFISFLSEKISFPDENRGYRDIVSYEDQFLAVGTNGRIDCINKSGEITPITNTFNVNLNGLIYDNQTIIAVGDGGTILVSNGVQACRKIETGTKKNINSITSFNGILIAAADKGTILISKNGNTWSNIQLPLKSNIVSVSADISFCIGVTNKGEIIKTFDGINWDIFDYNSKYAGYNKPCIFKKVLLTGKMIAVIGQHEDGSPVVLLSSLGNVWTERSLYYTDDHGMIQILTNLPNDVVYDPVEDQFFLACNSGEVVSLPSCTKCNKSLTVTGKDLHGIICSENILMIVGEDYYVNTINLR